MHGVIIKMSGGIDIWIRAPPGLPRLHKKEIDILQDAYYGISTREGRDSIETDQPC